MIWVIVQNAKDMLNLIRKKIEVFANFVISFFASNAIKNTILSSVVKFLSLVKHVKNKVKLNKKEIKEKLKFLMSLKS